MIGSTLPVRRRTRIERTVLVYLRGDAHMHRTGELDIRFHQLRQIATRVGLDIMPPGCAYVSQGEPTLLCWIASAQRMAGPMAMPDNRCLAEIVRQCADALEAVSLRLPSMTLYISRFREAGADSR